VGSTPIFSTLKHSKDLSKDRSFFVGFPHEASCSSLQKGGDYFSTDNLKNYSNIRNFPHF
jgi:hypothetical protein